jgi:hypothetical protein
MAEPDTTLGQLIWLVRRELEWAHQVDAGHPLRFDVGTVELDVEVEVSKATTGEGGLDLKVFGVGGSANLSREGSRGSATTVHVVLTPRDSRTREGKFEVSALDTEPPPRHAPAETDDTSTSPSERDSGLRARDSERLPAR